MAIEYIGGGIELLQRVRPMWEQLNQLNADRCNDFSDHFRSQTFEERMHPVLRKGADGLVRITIAYDDEGDIGYCISTIDREFVGEVDSIYISEEMRDQGIGGHLIDNALDWMAAFPVRRVLLGVTAGNEDAPRFYERHGFRPRNTVFERV